MPCFDKASVDTLETISLMQGDCNDLLLENELKINSHVLPVFFSFTRYLQRDSQCEDNGCNNPRRETSITQRNLFSPTLSQVSLIAWVYKACLPS